MQDNKTIGIKPLVTAEKKLKKKHLRDLIPVRTIIQGPNMTDHIILVTSMKDLNKTNLIMKDTRDTLENIPTYIRKQDGREVRCPLTIDLNLWDIRPIITPIIDNPTISRIDRR